MILYRKLIEDKFFFEKKHKAIMKMLHDKFFSKPRRKPTIDEYIDHFNKALSDCRRS
jgi:hypothetical protein